MTSGGPPPLFFLLEENYGTNCISVSVGTQEYPIRLVP